MNILLISFIDSTNIGDQLIVECMSKDLSKFGKVSTLSYNLTVKKEILPYHDKSTSAVKAFYTKYLRQVNLFDQLHGFLNKRFVHKLNWNNLEEALIDIDLVVLGGGNAIFALTHHTATTYKVNKIVDYIRQKSIPTLLLSAGVGPFKNDGQIQEAKVLLEKFQGITVRDEVSYSYVESLNNTFQSVDPVFFLRNVRDVNKVYNRIGICVMDIRANKATESEYLKYLDVMERLIKELLLAYPSEKIVLFSSEPRDNTAVHDVYKRFENNSNIKLAEISQIVELIDLYKTIDFLYGTRMHSMIVAHTQLIPVAGISWQPKVTQFFNIIGKSHRVFSLEEFENAIFNLVSIYGEVKKYREQEIDLIEKSISKLHDQYLINDELIIKIAEGRKNGKV